MRMSSFTAWVEATIEKELAPGRKNSFEIKLYHQKTNRMANNKTNKNLAFEN